MTPAPLRIRLRVLHTVTGPLEDAEHSDSSF